MDCSCHPPPPPLILVYIDCLVSLRSRFLFPPLTWCTYYAPKASDLMTFPVQNAITSATSLSLQPAVKCGNKSYTDVYNMNQTMQVSVKAEGSGAAYNISFTYTSSALYNTKNASDGVSCDDRKVPFAVSPPHKKGRCNRSSSFSNKILFWTHCCHIRCALT